MENSKKTSIRRYSGKYAYEMAVREDIIRSGHYVVLTGPGRIGRNAARRDTLTIGADGRAVFYESFGEMRMIDTGKVRITYKHIEPMPATMTARERLEWMSCNMINYVLPPFMDGMSFSGHNRYNRILFSDGVGYGPRARHLFRPFDSHEMSAEVILIFGRAHTCITRSAISEIHY